MEGGPQGPPAGPLHPSCLLGGGRCPGDLECLPTPYHPAVWVTQPLAHNHPSEPASNAHSLTPALARVLLHAPHPGLRPLPAHLGVFNQGCNCPSSPQLGWRAQKPEDTMTVCTWPGRGMTSAVDRCQRWLCPPGSAGGASRASVGPSPRKLPLPCTPHWARSCRSSHLHCTAATARGTGRTGQWIRSGQAGRWVVPTAAARPWCLAVGGDHASNIP